MDHHLARPRTQAGFAAWRATILLLGSLFAHSATADILISPQRVVMDDANRQAVISLHNPGDRPRSYRLEWVERMQSPGGGLVAVDGKDNPRSAASMLRFSPRQIAVPPGTTQTVRLNYRPSDGLAPGEYRSHLRIGMEPDKNVPGSEGGTEVARGQQGGMNFRLEALMSFAVPVFVRHGAGSVSSEITQVRPHMTEHEGRQHPALDVTLSRSGEHSAIGKLVVHQQQNANAPVDKIGETGGVAIYTELKQLTRTILLHPDAQLTPGSWIRVSYEGEGAQTGQVFSERVFQIGQ
jgi:hypothetical protein